MPKSKPIAAHGLSLRGFSIDILANLISGPIGAGLQDLVAFSGRQAKLRFIDLFVIADHADQIRGMTAQGFGGFAFKAFIHLRRGFLSGLYLRIGDMSRAVIEAEERPMLTAKEVQPATANTFSFTRVGVVSQARRVDFLYSCIFYPCSFNMPNLMGFMEPVN